MRLKPILRHPALWGGLLGLLWIVQSVVLVRGGNWGWNTLWRHWQRPLAWRSARFLLGERLADFTLFLQATIPEEATVVLPPASVSRPLGVTPTWAWLLFPRSVFNCTDAACGRQWMEAAGAYYVIVVRGDFPPEPLPTDRLRMWDDTWGVVVPATAQPLPQETAPVAWGQALEELGAELGLLGLMFLLGWGLLMAFGVPRSLPAWWVAAWALGSGGFTLGAYLLLLLGLSLKAAGWIMGGVALTVGGWTVRSSGVSLQGMGEIGRRSGSAWLGFALVSGWVGLIALLAVGKGYHAADALGIWGIKGYGIAQLGLRQGTYLGLVCDYPLHVPLLIGLPKALWGDGVGMSKLVFPFFLWGSVALLYWETYRRTRNAGWAFLGSAFLATVPLVVWHAEVAYANLPLAFYVLVGLWLWQEHDQPLAGGWALAWAVWTRPEAWLLVVAALLAGALGRYLVTRHAKASGEAVFSQATATFGFRVAWPPLLVTLFWLATKKLAYAYRWAPSTVERFWPAIQAFLDGEWHLWRVRELGGALLHLFHSSTWGLLGFVAIGLLLVRFLVGPRRPFFEKGLLGMAFAALGMLGALLVIYYFASYPPLLTRYRLETSFDRMILPAVLPLWYVAWRTFLGTRFGVAEVA